MCEESTENSKDNMVAVFKHQQCPEHAYVHMQAESATIHQMVHTYIPCGAKKTALF